MAETSAIEWCDSTFNPWLGCTKISAACDHCYAEGWARRTGSPELWSSQRRRTAAGYWNQPLRWQKQAAAFFAGNGLRQRVFCASLADVFDNQAPTEWRDDLWEIIRKCPDLDWLLLTKRPQNIRKMLPADWGDGWDNVWLGTTVENQEVADRNIPILLSVPARLRFISMEPLLGPVDLYHGDPDPRLGGVYSADCYIGEWWEHDDAPNSPPRRGVDWVIAGGESGPGARPSNADWFRSLRDQCAATNVPFLFKQWGEWVPQVGAVDGWSIDDDPEISRFDHRDWEDDHLGEPYRPMWCDDRSDDTVSRIGKKAAGRLLDGKEHNGFPEVEHHD